MIFAEFQVGQVLWSMFYFFIIFLWIFLVFTIFFDIIRSHDLSGWGKALWAIGIIFLPYIGIFLYLIVRGSGMSQRQINQAQEQEAAFKTYVQETASSGSAAGELSKLAELHNSGKLSDEEYAQAKSKVISS